ncbi:type II toxin-antitoxin system VapC family toxin [Halogeometricum luteum]|uniref:Type II toxin-antitoxin system VapC family toxin n=1 Tax=Halogeometricum luteum TaxID=2950537 RepID=A0ABU2G065_9EURY|nr:type II toxin-antitoxin system VapC family toxin [Halogeometricum sp. S3BR5-2]MDS0293634.1 type II toxin-antitoxin system VapC family toxin [Halogeometricum sp. S3BR5-2]
MIVLDNDVLVKLGGKDSDPAVVDHLRRYSSEEWTIPAIVAWEFYKSCRGRTEIQRARRTLNENLDRILEFTDGTAAEAAYLGEKLRSQEVSLSPADLLNLATAYESGGTFVTHNKRDFDKPPLRQLVDVDVIRTA